MSNPNDQINYVQGNIDNIYTVLSKYSDYLGYRSLSKTDDALIPAFPAITIDFVHLTEKWKEMPRNMTLSMLFDITCYYANISDKNAREGIRNLLAKVTNCLRENWSINGYCPRLGSEIKSAIPYVLASGNKIVVGGVIQLITHKVVPVTFA